MDAASRHVTLRHAARACGQKMPDLQGLRKDRTHTHTYTMKPNLTVGRRCQIYKD